MSSAIWNCYQHCYVRENYETPVPDCPSFLQVEKEYCEERGLEKADQTAFFAQYITEADCAEPTEWWFTIKDSEYDLSKQPAKKRYEVTKAHKFCEAREINPSEYAMALFECYVRAFDAYPQKYRPVHFDFAEFRNSVDEWGRDSSCKVYATFYKENGELIGFLLIQKKGRAVKLVTQKTKPLYEKYNSNAALVDCMLNDWNEKLKSGEVYITNGSRSIKHETNFNAYLEKYFGFRKAYAKLRVVYRFPFGAAVKILRPFKGLFAHTQNPLLYNLYCVLKMDSFGSK